MNIAFKCIINVFFFSIFLTSGALSQPWSFVKETDGIKVYTRLETNSSLKSFKGEVTFHASMERVCSMLGNANNMDWWDKDFTGIKVLAYEKNKFVEYYLIYTMPWPLTNRDLVTETIITSDPVTGNHYFTANELLDKVPEKQNLVRIKKYQQIWTVQPLENGNVHVIIQGSIDLGGDIPAWFYNMVVAETPMRALHSLRERVLSNKPANK